MKLALRFVLSFVFVGAGCAPSEPAAAPPARAASPERSPQVASPPSSTASIGMASMSDDGTITLRLRAETNGMQGEGVLVYVRGDKDYDVVLKHLGGIAPGESKPVAPWPE